MSFSTLRTTYDADELKRHANAPNKICGLYERLGSYKPVFGGSSYSPTYKDGTEKSNEGTIDSGLGDELPEEEFLDGPPKQPKLRGSAAVDSENHDSGLGPETEDMDTDEDDIEKDTVAVPPPMKPAQQTRPMPRMPKVNHIFTNKPTRRSPTTVRTTIVTPVTTSAQTYTTTESLHRLRAHPQHNVDLEMQQLCAYLLPNKDGDTGIHLAVIHGKMDILDSLLPLQSRLGPILDEQNTLYQTPLHLATHTQQTGMIRKLLSAGASLHLADHKGNTPLHVACKFSSTKCLDEILRYATLRTLLEVSQIRNNEGLTCVHIAVKYGNTDALRKLCSIGVDLNMQDFHSGKTALHLAVEKDSLSDVQFLVEKCRVVINPTMYSGCTPLHIASGRGNIAIVAYLISMGANPELLTDEGESALDLAGSEQVTTLLTKAAALKWLY